MKNLALLNILLIVQTATPLSISPEQTRSIAQKIWLNECKGNIVGLTTWRDGEKCASLGIGHFIWYPAGKKDRFHETFPDLVNFLAQRHTSLPAWLTPTTCCPWASRKAFYADIESKRMHELRSLLIRTINDQGLFIVKRFEETVPTITRTLSARDAQHVTAVIDQLATTPQGLYALIDYLNFKGAGIDPQERYHGKGWGLTQVLLATKKDAPNILEAFAQAAKKILTQRVHNAPKKQLEEPWLKGWLNRVDTYTKI